MSTGKRVKKAVKQSGMTQPEVASKAGVSKDHLHKVKQEMSPASIKFLARIAPVVKKPLDWFLKKRDSNDKNGGK